MMTTQYTIRRARPEDLAGVGECLAAAFEPYRASYTDGAYGDTVPSLNELSRRAENLRIFAAVDRRGRVVATVGAGLVSPSEGHLRGMAVLPEHQGEGLADEMLATAEAELKTAGCTRVTLDTTQPLIRAARFYQRNGYRATGAVRDFFGMPLHEYEKQL
jgi:ribosomal protein S18 acetylase RimI-like enzyme